MSKWTNDIAQDLKKPFDTSQIKWKPQVTTKGKHKEPIMRNGQQVAGCTAHIDARDVMNRLDEAVGPENWSDEYLVLNAKNVECRLTVLGVSKSDVGETNEGGFADPMKAAFSDALKRAAVKFGIGRHLYGMEMEWLPFDGYKIVERSYAPKTERKEDTVEKTNREIVGHDGTSEAQANTSNSKPVRKPKPQGNGNGNGNIDWRSKLQKGRQTLSTVCSIAANGIPTINAPDHALAVLEKHFQLPEDLALKWKWEMTQGVTQEWAVKMFDAIDEHEKSKA